MKTTVLAMLILLMIRLVPAAAGEPELKKLNERVQACIREGCCHEAEPLAMEALREAQKTFGAEKLQVAAAFEQCATVARLQGNYTGALGNLKMGRTKEAEGVDEKILKAKGH
jgi:hypothetical protein